MSCGLIHIADRSTLTCRMTSAIRHTCGLKLSLNTPMARCGGTVRVSFATRSTTACAMPTTTSLAFGIDGQTISDGLLVRSSGNKCTRAVFFTYPCRPCPCDTAEDRHQHRLVVKPVVPGIAHDLRVRPREEEPMPIHWIGPAYKVRHDALHKRDIYPRNCGPHDGPKKEITPSLWRVRSVMISFYRR